MEDPVSVLGRTRTSARSATDPLLEDLLSWPGDTVTSELERVTTAHDASHYLLHPRILVRPHTAAQVGSLLRVLRRHGAGLTFRSGGTSLSGQAVSDQVLVDVRRNFRGFEILDDGARVRIRPGSTVRQVNAGLTQYGRKLGPDPASESACTLGGVIANNSSSMHCGTEFNTYQTLESMVLVTPSGTVLDTSDPDADRHLREAEPHLHDGLLRLAKRITGNTASVATIQRLFAMKNTMGYGLNAFLDQTVPVKILERLMIGSEGTLGFVAEAVFRTVPVHPKVATGLLVFPDLVSAAGAVPALKEVDSATVELMDATSLRVAQAAGQVPAQIASIDVREHTALLVEYNGQDDDELRNRTQTALRAFRDLPLVDRPDLTENAVDRAALWTVRKGLYAAVAGHRPSGTNALLEDVVVPVAVLGKTCESLTEMFTAHGYRDSVIFGHAKDGNVHFLLNEDFADPVCLDRYEQFTEDMVDLILDNGGSLKAEHGTGRIMAPYVRRQYGDELYEVMVELKRLVDPSAMFNPGVILNDDPRCYVQDLKIAPTVEEEVDRCVECGYCEPVCPSQDLTLTPRQRIVGRREIADAQARGDDDVASSLLDEYAYHGEQTCAVDGMCSTACPVAIDTGDLVRRLRAESASRPEAKVWQMAAGNWGQTVRGASTALSVAKTLPSRLPKSATRLGRLLGGSDRVPEYQGSLPKGGPARPSPRDTDDAVAVFFPACVSAMFGQTPGAGGGGTASSGGSSNGHAASTTYEESASDAFLALCDRAGVKVIVPEGVSAACCGTPWKSKGMAAGYDRMTEVTLPMLWAATDAGRLPVICDASSCTEGLEVMKSAASADPRFESLRFVDAVQFVAEHVLSHLQVTQPVGSMVLHPTCSSTQLGLNAALNVLAQAAAEDVVTPLAWNCCGYAGDRGMLHPELTASATARESAEIAGREFDAYASLNRTCELGMTQATGQPYLHILQHLEAATR